MMSVNDLKIGEEFKYPTMIYAGDGVYGPYLICDSIFPRNAFISFIDKDYVIGTNEYNSTYIFIRLKQNYG